MERPSERVCRDGTNSRAKSPLYAARCTIDFVPPLQGGIQGGNRSVMKSALLSCGGTTDVLSRLPYHSEPPHAKSFPCVILLCYSKLVPLVILSPAPRGLKSAVILSPRKRAKNLAAFQTRCSRGDASLLPVRPRTQTGRSARQTGRRTIDLRWA